jgi:hypothetical protein
LQIHGTMQFTAFEKGDTPFIGMRMEIFKSPSCIYPTTLRQQQGPESGERGVPAPRLA